MRSVATWLGLRPFVLFAFFGMGFFERPQQKLCNSGDELTCRDPILSFAAPGTRRGDGYDSSQSYGAAPWN